MQTFFAPPVPALDIVRRPAPMRNGAKALLDTLVECGIDTIFGYPGGAALPLYDALHGEPRLRHILVRHEQAAMHAARLAMARWSNGYTLMETLPLCRQAHWHDSTQQQFMAWLAAGGFAQAENSAQEPAPVKQHTCRADRSCNA